MTSFSALHETPDHWHGVGSLGFQSESASSEPFNVRFQSRRAAPWLSMAETCMDKKRIKVKERSAGRLHLPTVVAMAR